MKKALYVVFWISLAVAAFQIFLYPEFNSPMSTRIGPARLYPDVKLTPGDADTLNLADLTRRYDGLTYSQAHRGVKAADERTVCKNYDCKVPKEIDHFYPLCAGGSNDIENLWAQPEKNVWGDYDYGYHAKDKLESFICAKIKAGELDPKSSYERMTRDWVKFYQDMSLNKVGATPTEIVE